MMKTIGYATGSPPAHWSRSTSRTPRPSTGRCRHRHSVPRYLPSDIHSARNEWGWTPVRAWPWKSSGGSAPWATRLPFPPRRFGQTVVWSIAAAIAKPGRGGLEQHCENGFTGTHGGGEDKIGGTPPFHLRLLRQITVDEFRAAHSREPRPSGCRAPFALRRRAPLLRHGRVGTGSESRGDRQGAWVHGRQSSPMPWGPCRDDHHLAGKRRGRTEARRGRSLLSTDEAAMQAAQNSFDFLLNTIPVGHNVDPLYGAAGKRDATMVIVRARSALTRSGRWHSLHLPPPLDGPAH